MYIAIDIGGTNTRVGASKDGRNFFAVETFKTPARFQDGIKAITNTVLRLTKAQSLKYKIAIAVPGSIDTPRKKIRHLPNLPGWSGKPISRALTKQLHTKILLINDADAAGIGEARQGAGKKYRRVLYLTISTGIGGARIIDGAIDPQAQHFEPGHFTLIPRGRKCGCGRRGCFEAYGSGTGFYKTYGVRAED